MRRGPAPLTREEEAARGERLRRVRHYSAGRPTDGLPRPGEWPAPLRRACLALLTRRGLTWEAWCRPWVRPGAPPPDEPAWQLLRCLARAENVSPTYAVDTPAAYRALAARYAERPPETEARDHDRPPHTA